jgi:hypothetical protein
MQKIGTVAFVQIQRYSMKKAVNYDVRYDAEPLLRVDKLWLTDGGIMGVTADKSVIVDVHSVPHPESKCRGCNKISFGFLPNYVAMRERFGDHMADGIAGENILIEVEGDLPEDVLDKEWILETNDGQHVRLDSVMVAAPCRPFSIFCAQAVITGDELKQTIQFLHDGRRGYYADLAQSDLSFYIQAGDTLYLR